MSGIKTICFPVKIELVFFSTDKQFDRHMTKKVGGFEPNCANASAKQLVKLAHCCMLVYLTNMTITPHAGDKEEAAAAEPDADKQKQCE